MSQDVITSIEKTVGSPLTPQWKDLVFRMRKNEPNCFLPDPSPGDYLHFAVADCSKMTDDLWDAYASESNQPKKSTLATELRRVLECPSGGAIAYIERQFTYPSSGGTVWEATFAHAVLQLSHIALPLYSELNDEIAVLAVITLLQQVMTKVETRECEWYRYAFADMVTAVKSAL